MARKWEKLSVAAATGRPWLNRVLTYQICTQDLGARTANAFKYQHMCLWCTVRQLNQNEFVKLCPTPLLFIMMWALYWYHSI